MSSRDARAVLAEVLEGARPDLTVVAAPPAQVANTPVVFFGGMTRQRVTQGGGDAITVTLLAIASSHNEWSFDELDDLCDDIDATLDDVREVDGVAIMVAGDGEWQFSGHEIAGQQFVGASLEVELHT